MYLAHVSSALEILLKEQNKIDLLNTQYYVEGES